MKKVLFSLGVLGLFSNADAMQPDQQVHAGPFSNAGALSVGHIGTVQANTDIDEFTNPAKPIMSHNLSSKEKDYIYIAGKTLFIGKDVVVLTKSCLDQYDNIREVERVVFEQGSKLERIDDEAFADMNVEEVNIPNSVRELGDRCFEDCKRLMRITFGTGSRLERIRDKVLSGTNVEEVSIPDSVEVLGDRCFYGCKSLRRIRFGTDSRLERVGAEAFSTEDVTIFAHDNILDIIQNSDLVRYNNLKQHLSALTDMPIDLVELLPDCPLIFLWTQDGIDNCLLVIRAGVQTIRGKFSHCIVFEEGSQLQSVEKEQLENVKQIYLLGRPNWPQEVWDKLPVQPIKLYPDTTPDVDATGE